MLCSLGANREKVYLQAILSLPMPVDKGVSFHKLIFARSLSLVITYCFAVNNFTLQKEIVDPAVKGTLNVLKASSEARVKRVVFVSTGATITMTPNPPNDNFYDERCWSDIEFLRAKEVTKFWSHAGCLHMLVISCT